MERFVHLHVHSQYSLLDGQASIEGIVGKAQHTVADKGDTLLQIEGRHDPCVVPRAIPVVRAMCALVLMDMVLLHKTSRMTPQSPKISQHN